MTRAGPLLCLLAGLVLAAPALALETEECRLAREGLPAAFAECGSLTVPEDPDDPEGRTLSLFFARIAATTATPAPDPLVLINGGPGGSTVDLYLQARAAFAPVLRDRDIVLLDQRGTGRSLAGLTCDIPETLALETASPETLRAAVENCIAEFPLDPAFFTTSVAVRDLDALRQALGVTEWNLYGVSYGTRVAQHYLRRYPDSTRSVILDGVVPAELVLGPDIALDAQSALDAIIARCNADAACGERFPRLAGKFAELRERFDDDAIELMINDPTTGEPKSFELGEPQFQSVVRLMSYADATAALLPLVIDETYRGNYAPLAAQADLLIASVAESIGFAMHNSVVCTEDVPYFDEDSDALGQAYLGTTIVDGLRAICEIWPSGVIDDDFKAPVTSDRPVLLLSGENDPVTPPDNAEIAIEGGLSRSLHIVAAGKGHGVVAAGCIPTLVREFLASADPAGVDPACVEIERPMPFFMNFQGPTP